ncbi:hypothetical protein [Myxococcus landrumensis]|uniref:DUF2493 domain-containing protein n=1 Tax=Myxococcus landrumensis TaxID=2813577 RepID=A0ABX7N954_9BACT|nr:hypothetical protein [Myxococcus landrumus]QSQ14074.1 hypothetical protein JY572_38130 [Myxococcus landrumus]
MRLVATGSRALTEVHVPQLRLFLRTVLRAHVPYETGFVFGHGAQRGADTLLADALAWCASREPALWMPERPFPARWKSEGAAAGPKRNRRMFDAIQPTYFVAAHTREDLGRGTRDMIHNVLLPVGVPGALLLLDAAGNMVRIQQWP